MRVEPALPNVRGVDTIQRFGPSLAKAVKAAGFAFVVRYLGTLTTLERNVILQAGLGLLAVTYSRRPSWKPSAELGDQDGLHTVGNARIGGLPPGMTLFCDLEGPGGVGADSVAYVNAWANRIIAAGFRAGLYVGYGIRLNSEELYRSLKVDCYWDSCSRNPDVAHRGFSMVQESPPNQRFANTLVDVDRVQVDKFGDTPYWLIEDNL